MSEQNPKAWYAASVISGKERIVVNELRKLAKSNHMKDFLFRIFVPTYIEVDEKGRKKEKLLYSRTIYVEMVLNEFTYGEIRISNFGFLLPSTDPTPIEEEEIKQIFQACGKDFDDWDGIS
ncbi:transcription termination/antitermination NusG family protein [Bacillus bombysepticus]|uniref:transcription termination/antitermination NusG family protein n=1 Tax=Bacillus bombysepticus TaxID=658666 RepID=UPI003018B332